MVGHNHRQQDIGERKTEGREQCRIPTFQLDDFAMDAVEEDVGIEGTGHDGQGDDVLHTVDAKDKRQPLIQQMQRIDEEGQQWVAVNLVDHIPVSHRQIGVRVVACQMKFPFEHLPIRSEAWLHKQLVKPMDEKNVERNNHQQHHNGLDSFLWLDFKE